MKIGDRIPGLESIYDAMMEVAVASAAPVRPVTEDILTFPDIEVIPYPKVFNRDSKAWMCRASQYTFCKRRFQNSNELPNCTDCAIRR